MSAIGHSHHPRARLLAATVVAAVLVMGSVADSARAGAGNVAALQVALRALHYYRGTVDGVDGPMTRAAVRSFQRRHHLAVDGIAGPRTRRALGHRGRPSYGSRLIRYGDAGWDVAALQFLLMRTGFSPGSIDGGFGHFTRGAVLAFQRARGLGADGVVGRLTRHALSHRAHRGGASGPVRFFRPVSAPMGDGFGPRGGRMHTGIDFLAPYGTRVGAGGRGVVSFAGWNSGGYGYLVVISHRLGFSSWYAHLSRISVWRGESVVGGTRVGYVGATGRATGPHLHFEVRRYGIPINPLPYLLSSTGPRRMRFGHRSRREDECAPDGGGPLDPKRARLVGCG